VTRAAPGPPVTEAPGRGGRAALPRVLFVSGCFHPTVGGAERQLHGLARALRRRGGEVLVLTHAVPGAPRSDEIDGVPVYRGIRTLAWGPVFGLTYMLSTLAALLRLRGRYDVVQCQQLYLHAPVAVLCQTLGGAPAVVRLAGQGPQGDVGVMRAMRGGAALLRVAARARRFVALSREGAAEARDLGVPPERVALIPNGVLLSDDGTPGRPAGGDFLLYVGWLRRAKGLDDLLEALARMEDRLELRLVGDGPERAALEARARTLKIADRVRFVGQVADPSPHYAGARLFALPSLGEGLSNALLEAMAFGLPVVATRIGGNVDLVEDGVNGLLVEPGDPAQLAAALTRLLRDEPLARRLGAAARRTVLGGYTMDRTVARYVDLYRAALGAAPAPGAR
jgi:glycosyltransferase involved in cell wall biosynthesis